MVPVGAPSLPDIGNALIELEPRTGFESSEIEGRKLMEVGLELGRAACGGYQGRWIRQGEMEEDSLHGGWQDKYLTESVRSTTLLGIGGAPLSER